MAAPVAASRPYAENGCSTNMFHCLVNLWDWFDPQEPEAFFQMDNNKHIPATQQPLTQHNLMAHHVHPGEQIYVHKHPQMNINLHTPDSNQLQPNGVMQQLLQSQYQSNIDARSPLLENRHEIYGQRQNVPYARHYGANENYSYPQSPPRTEMQDINTNSELFDNMPKGYNAEVYQDYMKRNPPKDSNQIYQNHQPLYNRQEHPAGNHQDASKGYLPYPNRIGPQSNTELLKRQYNEIQQMKLNQQMQYQSQAQIHQQQKFAERQLLLQQIHGVQPPPNMQNSIYSDESFRDIAQYSSRNDFKEYNPADIQKDIDKYAKNNEFRESEKINNQYQTHWKSNQPDYRDADRSRRVSESDKTKTQSPPSEMFNQSQKNNVGVISPIKSSESSSPSIKSPSSEQSRRSSGPTQTIRSPTAQRIPSAPVTLCGILYKQGSDGLKVWRKRWFVLSEYCLFYYKGQEEEKLLGSVLLPSYKVSLCSNDDKVRKFAFKLEHANMRTYVLAATDLESMMKWVKVLTMATLMQNLSEPAQALNDRAAVKIEDNDEIPGPTYENAPPKPRRSNEGYNSPSSDVYDPNYDLLKKPASQYSQSTSHPRYQDQIYQINPNAMYPRSIPSQIQPSQLHNTKRSMDTHNLSLHLTNPSSENLDMKPRPPSIYNNNTNWTSYDRNQEVQNQEWEIQPDNASGHTMDNGSKNIEVQSRNYNEGMEYEISVANVKSISSDQKPNMTNPTNENYGDFSTRGRYNTPSMNERLNSERRTPDAYGRSTTMSSYSRSKVGDYEDVYGSYGQDNAYGKTYMPSKSPLPTEDVKSQFTGYNPPPSAHQEKVFTGPAVLRKKKMQSSGIQPPVPRPHSADFLEYDSKYNVLNKTMPSNGVTNPPKQPQRPKSSLDINSYYDPSSDRYYSEESYAEKMRQSAQYLRPGFAPKNIQIPLAKYASGLAEKQLNSAFPQNANHNYETGFKQKNQMDDNITKYEGNNIEAVNSNWVLREKEMQSERMYAKNSGSIDNTNAYRENETALFEAVSPEGFIRSASARLPSTSVEKEGEKKVQQREESMKRLLEWKQRMLQSPLTRKSTPATISLARSLNHSRQSLRSDQSKQKNTSSSYNNYSSDDEEESTDSEVHKSRELQAGRFPSPVRLRPITPHLPPSQFTSLNNSLTDNISSSELPNDSQIDNLYENMKSHNQYSFIESKEENTYESPNYEDMKEIVSNPKFDDDTEDSEAESEGQMEYTDDDLDEVLMGSEVESKDTIAENGTLKKKTQDATPELDETPSTPPIILFEDHYLPMSPRKTSVVEPAHKTIIDNLNVFDKPIGMEDNPYVEMNLGTDDEDLQTYEIVCINNGKAEPVYMELNTIGLSDKTNETSQLSKKIDDTASNFADSNNQTLKRASKVSKSTNELDELLKKTDLEENSSQKPYVSDADDELSKDPSLDMPFSRLSISDTFRPASYYLNGSVNTLNRKLSSESETASHLSSCNTLQSDDMSNEALSKYVMDKLDQSNISQDSSILKMLTAENQHFNTVKKKTTSLMIYGSKTSIHDTLSRGEKIRSNRASLNERNRLFEASQNMLQQSMFKRSDSNKSIETDSLNSFNADKGSSQLSLDSDISSKFEMTPSNFSSEVTSINESEMMTSNDYVNIDPFALKRRPVSENSLFPLVPASSQHFDEVNENIDLDLYLDNLHRSTVKGRPSSLNSLNNSHVSLNILRNENITHPVVSHTRCSSTPVSQLKKSKPSLVSHQRYSKVSFDTVDTAEYESSSSFNYSRQNSNESGSYDLTNRNQTRVEEADETVDKSDSENNVLSSSIGFHSRESSTEHSAPYYYSDLSSQEQINILPISHYLKNTNLYRKLNNQRRRISMQKKNEISHIHNPINNNQNPLPNEFELAAARSISVEFLSAADKDLDIDVKNIYESRGFHSKVPETMKINSDYKNLRISHSENIDVMPVDNHISLQSQQVNCSSKASISSPCSENSSNTVYYDAEADACAYENLIYQGDKLWEEDTTWRDNLRKASHRHARSMDDLDCIPIETNPRRTSVDPNVMNSIKRVKKQKQCPGESVTYVNCVLQGNHVSASFQIIEENHDKNDDNDVYVSLVESTSRQTVPVDEGVYEQLAVEKVENPCHRMIRVQHTKSNKEAKKRFEIDREKLRQWDLMSSGLVKNIKGSVRGIDVNIGVGDVLSSMDSGAESTSLEATMALIGSNINPNYNNYTQQSLSKKQFIGSNTSIGRNNRDSNIPVRAVSPRVRWVEEKSPNDYYGTQMISSSQQNLSTVEDLWANTRSPSRASQQPIRAVSPRVRKASENDDFRRDNKSIQRQIKEIPTAGELLGRTHEELVLLLIQLRRRHSATHRAIENCCAQITSIEDCLSSLKAIERKESLQRLDQLKMQLIELENQYEKSKPLVQLVDNMVKLGSLYNRPGSTLERLERNQRLRHKVLAEHAMEQQRWLESAAAGKTLETEAARVRVAELWALEQELADEASILRGLKNDKDAIESLITGVRSKFDNMQMRDGNMGEDLEAELARVQAMLALNSKKLEQTVEDNARLERELTHLRRALHAQKQNAAPSSTATATSMLEDEVTRVQQLVSALQRQRQELSRAVRHLTQQSQVLQTTHNSLPASKRRMQPPWQESNSDGRPYEYDSPVISPGHYDNVQTPLYVDTRTNPQDMTSPITSEDMINNAFANLSNVEKQEIKTVRIVKRESERRQRDRERSFQPMSEWPNPTMEYYDEDPNRNNKTDYGRIEYSKTDYGKPDISKGNYSNSDYAKTEYGKADYGKTDYGKVDYNKTDYTSKDYNRRDQNRQDFTKFEEYYSKGEPSLRLKEQTMDSSPKFPSSPSLSTYDYSKDISYKPYARHEKSLSNSTQYLNSPSGVKPEIAKTNSITSLTRSTMELSPIFKSEAAKQIITEMSTDVTNGSLHRRPVPKEKRRHYTAPHHLSAKTLNDMPKDMFNPDKMGRSLDDTDMERALRAPPDVVRSAIAPQRIAANTIDQLLAAPQKILIPERYIPEILPELSPEEQQKRMEKVESIKKMLSSSSADPNKSPDAVDKKQREHLLQMNQILAKQVTEMSKIIAVKALEDLPLDRGGFDLDDQSPDVELPIYQQRDNFFT